jgi:hypothetical protein
MKHNLCKNNAISVIKLRRLKWEAPVPREGEEKCIEKFGVEICKKKNYF